MKAWPKPLQWLCGLISHADRNYADDDSHYAYCIRCGKLFGHPWGSDRVDKENWMKIVKILRDERDLARKRAEEFAVMFQGKNP